MATEPRYVVNEPKVAFESFENELVLVNLENGSYYTIDNTGAYVWGLVANGLTVAEAAARAAQRFTGDPAKIVAGVASFVAELDREGLIREDHTRTVQHDSDAAGLALPFEAPKLVKYTDMEQLLLLDPVHEVDETGWPNLPPEQPG